MKLLRKLIAASLFCISYSTSAQQIQTDRPNETESPNAISRHHLQVESGFTFEQDDHKKIFEVPEIVLRYGLVKNLEFRIESALKTEHEQNNDHYGIKPIVVGLKYHIADHKGAIPDIALLARTSIPWLADNAYQEPKYSPELRVLVQHELSKSSHLGYNAGVHWLPERSNPEYIYTISGDHSLTKKIKLVVEAYGFAEPDHHAKNTADAALLFLVNKNLQVDFIAGTGVMHAYSDKFAKIGLSFRI
ncbi:transporter [Flavobacterium sp. 245]|uniref:transporter n=1 Tax=Flavobacterium sp. 245 TaxID=2512115 RepID=UPI001061AAC5|nr:transporter [Flavobacterium sp. 245]TDP00260.1 outer membrane putative beta-barrel porin/alpha-amylase [Flavobacterium sp. 245]